MPDQSVNHSVILKHAPVRLRAYLRLARLDRLVGFWLLLLPSWWGIALANLPEFPDIDKMLLCGIGAILMRSAGCICNDLTDQKYDALVKRTNTRPLVNGSLTRRQAYIFLIILATLAAGILFQLNNATIMIGIIAAIMIIIYPWMKRITFWPQAFLGLTFNLGILMGWTLVRGRLETAPILLYLAAFFWTLHYDTVYAHQDKEDDQLIGVGSTALKFGHSTLLFLVFCASCFAILMTGVGIIMHLPLSYYSLMGVATLFIFYQSFTTDFDNQRECATVFSRTKWVGWVILLGIISASFY